jgi:hypothetical protein
VPFVAPLVSLVVTLFAFAKFRLVSSALLPLIIWAVTQHPSSSNDLISRKWAARMSSKSISWSTKKNFSRDHLIVSGVLSSHGSSDGSSSSSSSLPASMNAFAWYSHHSTTFLRTGPLTYTKDVGLATVDYQQPNKSYLVDRDWLCSSIVLKELSN